ncbi:hypothetical protein [Chryseobacterium shigense]|uniref:Uncharacterized protein n=1 Tax=Chryseobacterium shigense TaxID=297244 RepID=A0A841N8B4_9FLAO|nr:hypothetical protein [Chryseobacterium shigense]MBB6369670.1 hypothetical protein [Chryseobacterium shigense]
MKDQMMHWMGSDLVLTPNRIYRKIGNRILIVALLFLILGLFLFIRLHDFWQMPLAIAFCLGLPTFIHKIAVVQQKVIIPPGKDGQIVFCIGNLYQCNVVRKNEAVIVRNTLNGRAFYAVADQQNRYGKSYQISPFLNRRKRAVQFEEEVFPVIRKQLEIWHS